MSFDYLPPECHAPLPELAQGLVQARGFLIPMPAVLVGPPRLPSSQRSCSLPAVPSPGYPCSPCSSTILCHAPEAFPDPHIWVKCPFYALLGPGENSAVPVLFIVIPNVAQRLEH